MPINWLSRRVSDYAKVPYKKAIWVGKARKLYKKEYFKINEPIVNSLGAYLESDEPTYNEGHIEVYIYDITNALQMRLANEAKEKAIRKEKYNATPQWYRVTYERLKDVTAILSNKIQYPSAIKLDEQQNMKMVIKFIAPSEYRAVKELKSLEKILKTDKPANPLMENKNTIMVLIIGVAALYIVGHYILHMF